MAIFGIVNTNDDRPRVDQMDGMAAAMGPIRGEDCLHRMAQSAGLGVTSGMASTSLYFNERVIVACDVEIYDQKYLPRNGKETDRKFSPAAFIADLYLREGEQFLEKLHGVFSIAIWDGHERRLLLARDRLGVKALCYGETKHGLIFASYPNGVLASGLIPKAVDSRAIVDYLNFNAVPAPRTAFAGISKLTPGEYLVWQRGKIRKTCYWKLRYTEEARGTERELAKELFSQMEQSVRVTSNDLDPDQVGCFLSGGTDSSSIAGLFTRISQRPAHTFSIGFTEKRFDELKYAQLAARHFGLKHHEHILQPVEAQDIIPKIVDLFDEPFANASAIPTYACLELAKSHGISVMLGGDGGDELFGGNERYRIQQIYDFYQRVPGAFRKVAEPMLFALPTDRGVVGKAKKYIRRSNIPNPERYSRWRLLQVFPASEVLGDMMPHVNGDSLDAIRVHYLAAPAHSELNRLLYVDINMTLGDEDLPKVVRTAEGAGISVRFPYLHHSLAEFSGRLPVHLKVKGLKKRYLFKRAMQGFLPTEILEKKKHGFGLPIGMWLKTDPKVRAMAHDVLLSPVAYQRGYFRKQFIEKLISNLEQDDTPYYGDLLWVFLMLELWHRRHVSGAAL
jgi:asparagine synthase (glutamine-hydrolysing)